MLLRTVVAAYDRVFFYRLVGSVGSWHINAWMSVGLFGWVEWWVGWVMETGSCQSCAFVFGRGAVVEPSRRYQSTENGNG